MANKRQVKKAPKLDELAGSTVVSVELDPAGHAAEDRVVVTLTLTSGKTWRASRAMLLTFARRAWMEVQIPLQDEIHRHLHATDELVHAEESKDALQEVVQSIRDYFRVYGDGDEILEALDPRRIRDEVCAKLEEEDKKSEAEAEDTKEAPQAILVRASDLEVDL